MSAAMADSSTPQGKALREKASKMLDKIAASQKLEGEWLKSAGAATLAYIGEMDKDVSETGTLYEYNILHANVETIIPAVINSSPIPDIRRRFLDTDEDGRQVAELIERAISVQVDDNALDVELEMVAQDAFLGGRGVIRMRYENDDEDTPAADEADGLPVNLLIAKQRNGPTGDVHLTFLKPYTRFESAAKVSDDDMPGQ